MDPITQKIISLTITPDGESVSNVFQTYAWGHPDAAGIHTSRSTVDLTKGGMVMGKRWDTGSDWYVADTVISPLDGSQGTPGSGNKEWKSHPTATNDTEQDWTVPTGVTSICIIVVGGGAGASGGDNGGGGGLTWINDVPVTPGTTLKVRQGRTGGRNGSQSGQDTDGQSSYVKDASGNIIIQANPGLKNQSNSGGTGGNTTSNIGTNYQSLTHGGGTGGNGGSGKGGGGGAGGYSPPKGGDGGNQCGSGSDGQGGGGGDNPCAGHGETWGPGIGPPPEGCGGGQGGQGGQSEISVIDNWSFDPMALLIIGLCGATAWSLRRK